MQKRDHPPSYTNFSLIGNGAFGNSLIICNSNIGFVFKALDAQGQPVAIKRSQKVGNKVSREFEVLSELVGVPNVIQLKDFFYSLDS